MCKRGRELFMSFQKKEENKKRKTIHIDLSRQKCLPAYLLYCGDGRRWREHCALLAGLQAQES